MVEHEFIDIFGENSNFEKQKAGNINGEKRHKKRNIIKWKRAL